MSLLGQPQKYHSKVPLPQGMSVEYDDLGFGVILCYQNFRQRIERSLWEEAQHNSAMLDHMLHNFMSQQRRYEMNKYKQDVYTAKDMLIPVPTEVPKKKLNTKLLLLEN